MVDEKFLWLTLILTSFSQAEANTFLCATHNRESDMEKAFQLATSNIATHGDTDVFPYPVDNAIFHDCSNDVVQLLLSIEKSPDFDATLLRYPLISDTN
jgi:hypothetical protein